MSSEAGTELLREAIRQTLAFTAGATPDARAASGATLTVWRQVAARLAPVIGQRGVAALFERALHLTGRAFPWLEGKAAEGVTLEQVLESRLEARDARTALEAGGVVLITFTGLLATLIGSSLSNRLLASIWRPVAERMEQEKQP